MLLADQFQEQLEGWIACLLVPVVLIGGVLGVLWVFRRNSGEGVWEKRQRRLYALAYDRAASRATSGAADPPVEFEFHTYTGILVVFIQTTHRQTLPASVALEYLKELHKFNLVHCLIPYPGCIFVPVLSYLSFRKQRRKILATVERTRQPASSST
jgi:hypothetical protein